MISRKDKIYDYVKLHTKEMIDTHSLENSGSDALSIALDLKLDRTNVSRELNTLWKEGRFRFRETGGQSKKGREYVILWRYI